MTATSRNRHRGLCGALFDHCHVTLPEIIFPVCSALMRYKHQTKKGGYYPPLPLSSVSRDQMSISSLAIGSIAALAAGALALRLACALAILARFF